ncbi:MAG: NADH-quinone oxidoreductase subunit C [Candidatus Handelsmanbacteria bacterium]|nr:NADH-quinone oxidoreductase subunit C [Candidatus Handelsmanbacteria bacterium]
MTPQAAVQQLVEHLGEGVGESAEFRGEVTMVVGRDKIAAACRFLKEHCGFDMLTDLSGIDNYGEEPRFAVAYHLYSLTHRCPLRLKVLLDEDDALVDSVVGVWSTASWHEREAYDMFGIRFAGHPNLKRILMWEGYPHHPLRKDFPLAGLPADLPATAEEAGRVETANMLGGPYFSGPGQRGTVSREPRQYDTAAEQADKLSSPNKAEPV